MTLEADLIESSRFVEICEENKRTFSVQFTRLLLAAGSEIDVVAKQLCMQIQPDCKADNIDKYRAIIHPKFPAISKITMGVQWREIRVDPWSSWDQTPAKNPVWWRAYNDVKHSRHLHFRDGNLDNALTAIAGLYCLILHLDEQKSQHRPESFLRIESSS